MHFLLMTLLLKMSITFTSGVTGEFEMDSEILGSQHPVGVLTFPCEQWCLPSKALRAHSAPLKHRRRLQSLTTPPWGMAVGGNGDAEILIVRFFSVELPGCGRPVLLCKCLHMCGDVGLSRVLT